MLTWTEGEWGTDGDLVTTADVLFPCDDVETDDGFGWKEVTIVGIGPDVREQLRELLRISVPIPESEWKPISEGLALSRFTYTLSGRALRSWVGP